MYFAGAVRRGQSRDKMGTLNEVKGLSDKVKMGTLNEIKRLSDKVKMDRPSAGSGHRITKTIVEPILIVKP